MSQPSFNEVYDGKHYCAFEVMELGTNEKLMFIYDPKQNCVVALRSTNLQQLSIAFIVETNFPFLCKNAWEYFMTLYKKSKSMNENMIKFVRFVNPATMQGLDLKFTEDDKQVMDNMRNNSIINEDLRL